MGELRSGLRTQESLDELDALRDDIETWLAEVRGDDLLSRYVTHWTALEQVLVPGVQKARAELPATDTALASGPVYAACRKADLRAVFLRRLWRWYADRIEQRRRPPGVAAADGAMRLEHTMEAADELVWSCWKSTFTAAGALLPPPPLPFVDHRFTATATPRVTIPPDLASARDEILAAQVTRLPVPVIGLPAIVVRRPWWLILLAHESGHHVQYDLSVTPDLVGSVAETVTTAAATAGAKPEEVGLWGGWSRELFADAFSAAMVGPAALWAVTEIEHRPPAGMARSPAGTYPPPLVRLAVLRAMLSELGAPAPEPATPDASVLRELWTPPTEVLATTVKAQLGRVKAVASALLAQALGATTLPLLGQWLSAWYVNPPQTVHTWATVLRSGQEMPREEDDAARRCAAAGVVAWLELGATGDPLASEVDALAATLRSTLRRCRAPGTRKVGALPVSQVDAARDRLLDALDDPALAEDPEP